MPAARLNGVPFFVPDSVSSRHAVESSESCEQGCIPHRDTRQSTYGESILNIATLQILLSLPLLGEKIVRADMTATKADLKSALALALGSWCHKKTCFNLNGTNPSSASDRALPPPRCRFAYCIALPKVDDRAQKPSPARRS